MAYPRRLLTADETVLREFHPHWKTLIPALLAGLAGAVLAVGTWYVPPDRRLFDLVVMGVAVLLGGGFLVGRLLTWRTTQYVLTSERLIARRGIVSRGGMEIPLEQINTVSFSQSPLERLLRYGDLVIESAGERGQSTFTDIPSPEAFQSRVYEARDDRTASQRGGGPADVATQLEKLEALRDRGTLTTEEFEREKRRLLDRT